MNGYIAIWPDRAMMFYLNYQVPHSSSPSPIIVDEQRLKIIADTPMFDKPANETMVIRFFGCQPLFILFAESNQRAGFFNSETLVEEGVNEQVHVLLHMQSPPFVNNPVRYHCYEMYQKYASMVGRSTIFLQRLTSSPAWIGIRQKLEIEKT